MTDDAPAAPDGGYAPFGLDPEEARDLVEDVVDTADGRVVLHRSAVLGDAGPAGDASAEGREQSFVRAGLREHRHGHQEADDLREGSEVVRHAQNLPDRWEVGSATRMSRPGGRGVPRGASRKVRTPQSDGGG